MRLFTTPNSDLTDRDRTFLATSYFSNCIFDLKMSDNNDPIDSGDQLTPDSGGDFGGNSLNKYFSAVGLTWMRELRTAMNNLRK